VVTVLFVVTLIVVGVFAGGTTGTATDVITLTLFLAGAPARIFYVCLLDRYWNGQTLG